MKNKFPICVLAVNQGEFSVSSEYFLVVRKSAFNRIIFGLPKAFQPIAALCSIVDFSSRLADSLQISVDILWVANTKGNNGYTFSDPRPITLCMRFHWDIHKHLNHRFWPTRIGSKYTASKSTETLFKSRPTSGMRHPNNKAQRSFFGVSVENWLLEVPRRQNNCGTEVPTIFS